MSNVDENGSNLLPLSHIVLITYFVLLSGEIFGYDKERQTSRAISRKNRGPTDGPRAKRKKTGSAHDHAQQGMVVLQGPQPRAVGTTTCTVL